MKSIVFIIVSSILFSLYFVMFSQNRETEIFNYCEKVKPLLEQYRQQYSVYPSILDVIVVIPESLEDILVYRGSVNKYVFTFPQSSFNINEWVYESDKKYWKLWT